MTLSNQEHIYSVLLEMGWDMVLIKKTPGAYTPGVGLGLATETEYTFQGIMLEYKDEERDGTNILQKDRKCVISGFNLAVSPDESDLIRDDDNVVYTIVRVNTIRQVSNVIAHICQVRI